MKKLLMMFALVGAFAFASCSADKETQKKQDEAQQNVKEEAGDMPKFDENGNPIEEKKADEPKKDTTVKAADTTKKVEDAKKKEEPKK